MIEAEPPFIKVINPAGFTHLDEFCQSIEDAFRPFQAQATRSGGQGRVFVDLLPHGNFNYHLSNLLIAKYLSIVTGSKLVAFTSSRHTFVRFVFPNEFIRRIAEAFSVDEYVDLDTCPSGMVQPSAHPNDPAAVELNHHGQRYYGLEDRIRRRYKLGDYRVTLPEAWMTDEISASFTARAVLNDCSFTAQDYFVTGHLEYDPYKQIALACVKGGGRVYYNWVLQPITIKVLETVDEVLLNKVPTVREKFDELLGGRVPDPTTADALASQYMAALGKIRPTQVGEMTRKVGGQRSSQPNVVIMTQAMSDAVHGYGPMLFADFAEWIESTIEVLLAHDRHVTLRDHPMQHLYDQTGFAERLATRYQDHPCFHYVGGSDEFAPQDYSLCVTTQGTPGIEMPLYGVRTVAAGEARYTGFGLVDEPQDRQAYESLLLQDHALSETESAERVARAALFGFCELFIFRTPSRFLPRLLSATPQQAIDTVNELETSTAVLLDPLFEQVSRLVDTDAKTTFNPAVFRYCESLHTR